MAILVLTVQAAGQVYQPARRHARAPTCGADRVPLAGMALTYFFVNTVPIAMAIALTTNQSAWRIWKTDFASSAPSYLLGAAAAAVVIAVTESSGYWLTLLLTAAPLYLTYKMYRARHAKAKRGRARFSKPRTTRSSRWISSLNIREFNPAAEQMFGYARTRHPRPERRAAAAAGRSGDSSSDALNEYMTDRARRRSPAASSS